MNFIAKAKFRWWVKFTFLNIVLLYREHSQPGVHSKDKVSQPSLTQAVGLSVLQETPLCPACHTIPHHLKVTSSFSSEEWWVTPAGYPPSTWPAFYSWKMRGRAWRTPCCSITASKCCLPSKVLTLERAKSQGTLLPSRGQADSCLLSASSRSKSLNKKSLTKKKIKLN